ncbi:MAG: UbiA prenyltransferase family protein [Saprospiraceae bacterium]|nr:UbiA prenyltransferase family protein [Saprospiraceae bacterium]
MKAILKHTLTAFCALAMAWQTQLMFGSQRGIAESAFLWSATVFVYHFTLPSRWWAVVHGPIAAVAFFLLQPVQQLAALLPFALWLLYIGTPGTGAWGLRRLPWLKPLAVALAWTAATTLFPIHPELWTQTVGLCITRLVLVFALALAYDLHDRAEDHAGGLPTLAAQLGAHGTFRVIRLCWVVAALGILLDAGRFGVGLTVGRLLGVLLTAWLLERLFRPGVDVSWRKIAVDGLMLVQPVVVAIFFKHF